MRYVALPGIASERLELLADGRVRHRFKRPWRDDSVVVEYDPVDFSFEPLERRDAAIPAPNGTRQALRLDRRQTMLSAASLHVPTDGWTAVEGNPHEWFNAVGDSLVRNYFDVPPDLPPWSGSLDGIRATYRDALGNHGGLVEVERVTIGGHQAVCALLKVKQPAHGMAYMLVLTFPFRHCSFMVTVQCGEHGMTGMRDAAVAAQLGVQPRGPHWTCEDGQPWFGDPYDASYLGGVRRNRADDEAYDASFPDHPLSRVRAHLQQLRGITLPAETRTLAPFG